MAEFLVLVLLDFCALVRPIAVVLEGLVGDGDVDEEGDFLRLSSVHNDVWPLLANAERKEIGGCDDPEVPARLKDLSDDDLAPRVA